MKGTTLRIIQDKDNLNAIMGMQEQDVLRVMRALQEELHNNDLSPTDSLIIQESLLWIYNERQLLPSLTDRTNLPDYTKSL
ncbi:hypothetical protein BD410DRAFT_298118 [Rickenella mellea]|uniref:Uncharacterized protein n=1 Tax=Rickenella mellea TaxID=50990 RepID=A0A4Y7PGL2_9AGAM|nr:hypothetical protein BD410DRAFT_298118 [Rickenella mellea]